MKKILLLVVVAAVLMVVLLIVRFSSRADNPPNFSDPAFGKTWSAVDKPVQSIKGLGRGYVWGPVVAGSEAITTETYNGGTRKVQYFEKARMEINNPGGNTNDLFYVTTGLLVKELVTGARQDGDNDYTQLSPSTIQVAGDPNDGGANAVAPTYASFGGVATISGTENGRDSAVGSAINSSINKVGVENTISPPENHKIGAYDDVTRHNVADVFVDYGRVNGQIWNGNSFALGSIFFGNPTYVLGRPITEPYWIRAVVAGTERDVLVQLFERRVLTYTPSNPDGYKVEMGNVGQHYFKWRYLVNNSPTPPPGTTAAATPAPASLNAIPTRDVLTVNYGVVKNTFSDKMLGVNLVNWEHSWGKPYPNEIPGLTQALKAIHVGIIRYAGGGWSNSVGWDRNAKRDPYAGWPDEKNGPYWFQYNPEEIDSVARLAQAIGADVMVEVNINHSDPAMWADMVRYTNVEHKYGFKYWELGNELDQEKDAPSPDEYTKRLGQYMDAMLAVDPSLIITASGVASPFDAPRQGYNDKITDLNQYITKPYAYTSPQGHKIQALSYHSYQACNSKDVSDLQRYAWDGLADNSWRNGYSRRGLDLIPHLINQQITNGAIPQGITEFNFDTCNYDSPLNSNFLNALWTTDTIGRMAYNGVNFAARWQGYGTQAFALLYPDNGEAPTRLYAHPSYYSYLMYANYFGNQVVESSTNDNPRLSIWASRDSNNPGKLVLMVTNLSNTDIPAPVNMPGFNATSASLYQMRSANPSGTNPDSLKEPVTINGVSIDAMNVAGSFSAIKPVSLTVAGSSLNYTFPAYSTTAIVLTGNNGPVPTPDPRATATPTIGYLPTATATPAPTFSISASTSKGSVKPGDNIDITTTVRVDNAPVSMLVDTEVYCSADGKNWSKDAQQFWDDQSFSAGQTRTYTDTWKVPGNHPAATCAIKVGLFLPGWGGQLAFEDAGTFNIGR